MVLAMMTTTTTLIVNACWHKYHNSRSLTTQRESPVQIKKLKNQPPIQFHPLPPLPSSLSFIMLRLLQQIVLSKPYPSSFISPCQSSNLPSPVIPPPPPFQRFQWVNWKLSLSIYLFHSVSLALLVRWRGGRGEGGMREGAADSLLHLGLFWVSCNSDGKSWLVQSLTFSVQLFFCLPLRLPPSMVPRKMVLDRVTWPVSWPNHSSFLLFSVARRGSLWSWEHSRLKSDGIVGPAFSPRHADLGKLETVVSPHEETYGRKL